MKKTVLFLMVLSVSIIFPLSAFAHLSGSDIIGTWTGLQQEENTFNKITLVIESVSDTEQNPADNRYRNTQYRGSDSPMQPGTYKYIYGNIKIQLIEPNGRFYEPQNIAVSGQLIPSLNILVFQYQTQRERFTTHAVLNNKKNIMALVDATSMKNSRLPIYLKSGNDLPEAFSFFEDFINKARQMQLEIRQMQLEMKINSTLVLQGWELQRQIDEAKRNKDQKAVKELTEKAKKLQEEKIRRIKQKDEAIKAQNAKFMKERKQNRAKAAEILKQVQAVQQQALQAMISGDMDKAEQLQKKAKNLNLQYAAALQGKKITAPVPSSSCSDKLLTWASELEKNGASLSSFDSITQLTNLFRPSIFKKYFDDDLLSMDAARRRGIGFELGHNCTKLNNNFSRGKTIMTVAKGFADGGFNKLNYISAAIAGEALDIVGEWFDSTIMELSKKGNPPDIKALERKSGFLLNALWPNEMSDAKNKIRDASNNMACDEFIRQIDSAAAMAKSGDFDSLVELGRLSLRKSSSEFSAAGKKKVEKYFNDAAQKVLPPYLKTTFPSAANDMSKPREALIAGKQWHRKNGVLLSLFSNTESAKKYKNNFLSTRESLYQKIFADLKKEITSLNEKTAVQRYIDEMSLSIDSQGSKTWGTITALKEKRIMELDREAFIARVGDGPLKPGDPGAVYINALYRNDLKIIEEEDRAFREPLLRAIQPLFSNGLFEMMSYASNGDSLMQKVSARMRNTTMSTTLAGFYMVALKYISPKCLGPNPVNFERTATWDEVLVNGYGMELSRTPHKETYEYTIASRHAYAFKQIGDPANVETIQFISSIFSGLGLIPDKTRVAIDTLSANLKGLKAVMKNTDCSNEVIKAIEKNLISRALEAGR